MVQLNTLNYARKGFVLASTLIFLVIVTLLAVTAIRRTTMSEKIAGNLREQNIAFQSAERALRFCQQGIEATPKSVTIWDQDGVRGMPKKWEDMATWRGTSAVSLPPGTVTGVASQPQCLVERWHLPLREGVDIRGGGASNYGEVYLITARAVGSTLNSVVWLQTAYRTGTL